MPETDFDIVTKEWLQSELRSVAKDLIILDCRSSNEYQEGHIRSAVNFSIPSIMLRRLAAGKIDLISTIKCRDLKQRIQSNYKLSLFVLYNDNCYFGGGNGGGGGGGNGLIMDSGNDDDGSGISGGGGGCIIDNNIIIDNISTSNNTNDGILNNSDLMVTQQQSTSGNCVGDLTNTTTINVLHRRLKQDGCRVVCLQDGFSSFRDAFPEWCEEDNQHQEMESSRGQAQADQLMGLRSLRISTPHSDSACSSSAESSDCESTIHHHHHHHHHSMMSEAPVEIVPGLFLGNASHSGDSRALQKYNIKYVLNVTPDLPNVFEASGGIQYLQIPITDHYSQDLAVHFPTAIQFIEEARSKGSAVLVHCLAGVSRSVTVTLAYLMHTRSLCLNDAFSLVRDRKPDVSPNFHFMEQLHSFERQLRISPNRNIMPNNTILQSSSSKECEKCPRNPHNHNHVQHAKTTGVSPDSGIEFDRWTPSDSGGGGNNTNCLK